MEKFVDPGEGKLFYSSFLLEVVEPLRYKKDILKEYYERVDKPKDAGILKGLEVQIYLLDREEMTPHVHLVDNANEISIEVSLVDWSIIKVNSPKSADRDWSNFSTVRKRFFSWLENNVEELFLKWDAKNPDNLLRDYADRTTISQELKDYIGKSFNPNEVDPLIKEIYRLLIPMFVNPEENERLQVASPISILKELGLYEKYNLSSIEQSLLKKLENIVNEIKLWYK